MHRFRIEHTRETKENGLVTTIHFYDDLDQADAFILQETESCLKWGDRYKFEVSENRHIATIGNLT